MRQARPAVDLTSIFTANSNDSGRFPDEPRIPLASSEIWGQWQWGEFVSTPAKLTNTKDFVKYSMSSRAAHKPSFQIVGRSLLVSNDSSVVQQLTANLQQFAISADVCPDPIKAFNLINTRKFEAVIVDLALGEQIGNLLERVRLSPSNENSVTFALVSSDEESYLQVQPNFLIRKPLTDDEVGSTLKAALGLVIRDYRRYFRCPVTVPVLIRIDNKAEIFCEMMNVSEGGLAVATPVTFTPGAVVCAEFALPGESAVFEMDAEICWCNHKGHAGLQFRSVPQEKSVVLQAWLSRKIEESIPEPVARLFQKRGGTPDASRPQ